jgi:hypothetical protein
VWFLPGAARTATVVTDAFTDFGSERIQALWTYWHARSASHGGCPVGLDPTEIRSDLLPYLLVVDMPGPGRFRYRLVGTRISAIAGDFTGKTLSELAWGTLSSFAREVYTRAFNEKVAQVGTEQVILPEEAAMTFQWGVFPICDGSGKVVKLLEIVDFQMPPDYHDYLRRIA